MKHPGIRDREDTKKGEKLLGKMLSNEFLKSLPLVPTNNHK